MKKFRFRFKREELLKLAPLSTEERRKHFKKMLEKAGLTKDKYYVVQASQPVMDIRDPSAVFIVVECEDIKKNVTQLISPEGEILLEGKSVEGGTEWQTQNSPA